MTIPGFWHAMVEHGVGDERLPLRIYSEQFYRTHGRPLRIGIDLFMWLFEVTPPGSDPFGSMKPEVVSKLLMNLFSRLRELIKMNVSFVLVFDGTYKGEKRRWDPKQSSQAQGNNEEGRADYIDIYNEVTMMTRDDPATQCMVDPPIVAKIKSLLDDWHVTYAQAPGEGEAELGRLNSMGVIDAIISNDGDGFMFGAQTILRNCSKWLEDSPSSSHPKNGTKKSEFYVTPFRAKQIEDVTGLTRERIILFASLGGNDFSGGTGSLGETRAFTLAQIGSKVRPRGELVDFSSELSKIYVPEDKDALVRGCIPYGEVEDRRNKLDELSVLMDHEIRTKSKAYFGRAHNPDQVVFPSDYSIAMLYFPFLAPHIYCFLPFDTNYCESTLCEKLTPFECPIPQMQAILSPRGMDGSVQCIFFLRGNGRGKFGTTTDYSRTHFDPGVQVPTSPMSWFEIPNFKSMCELTLPTKTTTTRDFMVRNLGEAYVIRAIYAGLDRFRVDHDDLFVYKVKQEQILGDEGEDKWTTDVCQVRYDPEAIMSKYLPEPTTEDLYDENYNLISQKKKKKKNFYVPVQKYLLDVCADGKKLLMEYESAEKEKVESRKSSPKKRKPKPKLPRQSSTLDKMKISPIKFTEKSKSEGSSPVHPKKSPSRQRTPRKRSAANAVDIGELLSSGKRQSPARSLSVGGTARVQESVLQIGDAFKEVVATKSLKILDVDQDVIDLCDDVDNADQTGDSLEDVSRHLDFSDQMDKENEVIVETKVEGEVLGPKKVHSTLFVEPESEDSMDSIERMDKELDDFFK